MLSLERKCPTVLVEKSDCTPLTRYDNPLVLIVYNERIPKPSEHQCSCSQKIISYKKRKRRNLAKKKKQIVCLLVSFWLKEERDTYRHNPTILLSPLRKDCSNLNTKPTNILPPNVWVELAKKESLNKSNIVGTNH